MKYRCFFSFLLMMTITYMAHSQTFHAILFANTKNPDIGVAVEEDFQRMKIEFKAMANFIGYKYSSYEFKDMQFNRQNLERVINSISCEKDDIVFFYYSGHGGRSIYEKTNYPQMLLCIEEGYDSDLYPIFNVKERLKAKNPRLTIVMGDLCNSVVEGVSPKSLSVDKNPTIKNGGKTQFYKDLFFKMKGDIIAVSSEPKEVSRAYSDGSAFTTIFLNALQAMVSNNLPADWNTLLEITREHTNRFVQNRSNGKIGQHPIFDVNLMQQESVPIVEDPEIPTDNLEGCLTLICNAGVNQKTRIRNISSTLSKYFAHSNVRVQVIGRDGKTIVNTTTAGRYLNYLSIATNMEQVMVLDESRDSSGKVTNLVVHEMHKK